ncbi:hypothetical protein N0V83_009685 [Neocucurbitaria cava]|uniref:C3H1-type domain-containing protein n=1 Tax=Neocucurbitaria cava TaxID=798079 RepID=A0A9W8XZQ6_9PLEO|nr:hypothetical protein N0V83_009685 [Neocucurbitaria cava]
MPKRGRSNTKTPQKLKRVKLAEDTTAPKTPDEATTTVETDLAVEAAPAKTPEDTEDFVITWDDLTPPAQIKEEDFTMEAEADVKKDAFDMVLNNETPEEPEVVAKASDNKELDDKNSTEAALEAGKACLIHNLQNSFEYVPLLQSSLGLSNIGDIVTAKITFNSVECEVSLKVIGHQITHLETDATTTPTTTKKVPCRFGAACTKGDKCMFDHTIVTNIHPWAAPINNQKHCIWVNAPSGCLKGAECPFSHALEGVSCKEMLRMIGTTCGGAFKCPYKHDDDDNDRVAAQEETQKPTREVVREAASTFRPRAGLKGLWVLGAVAADVGVGVGGVGVAVVVAASVDGHMSKRSRQW